LEAAIPAVVGLADAKPVFLSKFGPESVVGNTPCAVTSRTLLLRFRPRLLGVLLLRDFLCLLIVPVLLLRGSLCLLGGFRLLRLFLVLVGRLGFLFLRRVVLLLLCVSRDRGSEGQRQNCCADDSD
jgi:hypothetical protein